jgi:hypothetical protein
MTFGLSFTLFFFSFFFLIQFTSRRQQNSDVNVSVWELFTSSSYLQLVISSVTATRLDHTSLPVVQRGTDVSKQIYCASEIDVDPLMISENVLSGCTENKIKHIETFERYSQLQSIKSIGKDIKISVIAYRWEL